MLTFMGYFDGKAIKTVDKIQAKKNQKVMITVLDEFMDEPQQKKNISMMGALAKYARPSLWEKEKSAWEDEVNERYDNS